MIFFIDLIENIKFYRKALTSIILFFFLLCFYSRTYFAFCCNKNELKSPGGEYRGLFLIFFNTVDQKRCKAHNNLVKNIEI